MRKRIISLICAALVLTSVFCSQAFSVSAVSYPNDVEVRSQSALLINLDANPPQTVFEKNADEKRFPASTTKIMTYIVAAESAKSYDQEIEVTYEALEPLYGTGSSMSGLDQCIGKKFTVLELLNCMMIPSGNDAAMVLAYEFGGGKVQNFVDKMNAKAKEIGCKNTHFMNPDGLHDENHYTTANDLALITLYAIEKFPEFSEITNTVVYENDKLPYAVATTNYMINEYNGQGYYRSYARGIKTGTTSEAGRCFVTMGASESTYLAVVLGCPYSEGLAEYGTLAKNTESEDYKDYGTMVDCANLFEWAFDNLESKKLKSKETPICSVDLKLAIDRDAMQLVPEKEIYSVVPSDCKTSQIITETDVPDSIDAPVKKGDKIGTATLYYKKDKKTPKQKLVTFNLVAADSVDKSALRQVQSVSGKIFHSTLFRVLFIIFIVLLAAYIIIVILIRRRNSRKRRRVKRYRNF